MINLQRALVDKVDHVQKQMGHVSKENGRPRKNKIEMLRIKTLEQKRRMLSMGFLVD